MKQSLNLLAEDLEIAQQVASAAPSQSGFAKAVFAVANGLLEALALGVLLLLMGAYLFGFPHANIAVQWSFYILCVRVPLDFARSSLGARHSHLGLVDSCPRAVEIEVSPSGLTVSDLDSSLRLQWSAITSVAHDGKYIYIQYRPRGAVVIPARCFAAYAEFEQFHAQILALRTSDA